MQRSASGSPCLGNVVPWGDGTPPDYLEDIPKVSDEELRNALEELFRPGASVPGGTAGAVRREQAAGTTVGGRSHDQKARERVVQLRRLILTERLNRLDRAVAEWMMIDLQRALDGLPRC